jgi:hypothetical protein
MLEAVELVPLLDVEACPELEAVELALDPNDVAVELDAPELAALELVLVLVVDAADELRPVLDAGAPVDDALVEPLEDAAGLKQPSITTTPSSANGIRPRMEPLPFARNSTDSTA